MDVLIAHAMGLQNIVLADLAGRNGGGVLFCGLGLVERCARTHTKNRPCRGEVQVENCDFLFPERLRASAG